MTDPCTSRQNRLGGRLARNLVVQVVAGALLVGSLNSFAYRPVATSVIALRINAGAGSVRDSVGQTWSGDRYYVGGGGIQHATGRAIAGTDDDVVFQTNRWGMDGYNIPVSRTGTYRVRLLFAETVFTSRGARVFDVSAEGRLVIDNLDVFARVGSSAAHVETLVVSLRDKTLNLRFGRVADDPMISGIEVVQEPALTTTTTQPAPTTSTTQPAPTTTTTQPAPPPPSGSSFPGPTNTGVPAGTVLRASGSITTSADGQVIDAMDVQGSIRVEHNNVTIKRTRIRQSGGQAITMNPSRTNLVIEDCELDGTGNTDGASAVGDSNFTIRRCNVHHFGEGPRTNGNNLVEDNWFHDFLNFVAQGAHQDVVQITGGSNIVLRHNTMDIAVDGANAAVMMGTYPGSDITVENNLLAGGGYTVYGGSSNGYTNVKIINNRFSTRYYPRAGYHGPLVYTAGAMVSGNVYHESGLPV